MAKNTIPLLLLLLTFFTNVLTSTARLNNDITEVSLSSSLTDEPIEDTPVIQAAMFIVTSANLTNISSVAHECAKDIWRELDIAMANIVVTVQDNAGMSFANNKNDVSLLGALYTGDDVSAESQTYLAEKVTENVGASLTNSRTYIEFIKVDTAELRGSLMGAAGFSFAKLF